MMTTPPGGGKPPTHKQQPPPQQKQKHSIPPLPVTALPPSPPQEKEEEGKKVLPEQQEKEAPVEDLYILQNHPGLQRVMRILLNGRASLTHRGQLSGGHTFWEHHGLVQKMTGAYEQRDPVMFFAILRTYLEKAALTIPAGGTITEVTQLVSQVEDLTYQRTTPFEVVARYILRIRNMPD